MADKLEFNGRDLQRISEKERRQLVGAEVAMIFQDPMTSLNPCYTVGYPDYGSDQSSSGRQ